MQKGPSRSKKGALPRAPFDDIKRAILGARYELSYGAVSAAEARALNKKYRKKSYVPDVLAFPFSASEGEIVLNTQALAREAKIRSVSVSAYTAYIFIHACLHLKGFGHGAEMTTQEAKYLKKFNLKDKFPVL